MLKSIIGGIVAKHMKRKLNDATIKEEDINEVLKEIRLALLDADVSLIVVKDFIKAIRSRAVGMVIDLKSDPQQVLLTVIKEELIRILGSKNEPIKTNSKIVKILMVGLQGSGKTTSAAKLAYYFKTKFNKKPLLVGLDIYRPAAIEQLQVLANSINVDFFEKGTQDPVKTADQALEFALKNKNDLVIFDTAGRLQTDEALMNELTSIRNKVSPDEILLVVDAMSGQDVINVAKEFNEYLNLSGFIITKLDSDARAGAALSLISILNIPIKFTGVGEKIASLDVFYPERMADRILGLGDIMTLAEKAIESIDQDKAKRSLTRILSGKMDLEDLLDQMQQVTKMGSVGSIIKLMPNAPKVTDEKIDEIENKLNVWRVLMSSMTLKERRNPHLFKKQPNRRTRVINGSGRKPDELNKLLSEFEKTKQRMDVVAKNIKKGKNPFAGWGGSFGNLSNLS